MLWTHALQLATTVLNEFLQINIGSLTDLFYMKTCCILRIFSTTNVFKKSIHKSLKKLSHKEKNAVDKNYKLKVMIP